jgi:hypothetical protein
VRNIKGIIPRLTEESKGGVIPMLWSRAIGRRKVSGASPSGYLPLASGLRQVINSFKPTLSLRFPKLNLEI